MSCTIRILFCATLIVLVCQWRESHCVQIGSYYVPATDLLFTQKHVPVDAPAKPTRPLRKWRKSPLKKLRGSRRPLRSQDDDDYIDDDIKLRRETKTSRKRTRARLYGPVYHEKHHHNRYADISPQDALEMEKYSSEESEESEEDEVPIFGITKFFNFVLKRKRRKH